LALIAWTMLFGSEAFVSAQPPALAPIYWQQRIFFIPYQVNRQAKLAGAIAKVQLLLSRDGTNDWNLLQEAAPNVQGFSYHAPADGEYWFALRVLDQRGRAWPEGAVQPQMRIIVDTQRPKLFLTGTMDAAGSIVVRYEARDANLRSETIAIQARSHSGKWSSLSLGPPDVAQPDRLMGRAQWTASFDAGDVQLRASIADRAGQRTEVTSKVTLVGPLLSLPSVAANSPRSGLPRAKQTAEVPPKRPAADPFRSTAQLPAVAWPADNRQTPAQLVADGQGNAAPRAQRSVVLHRSSNRGPFSDSNTPPLQVAHAPTLASPPNSRRPSPADNQAAAKHDGWTQPAATTPPSAAEPAMGGMAARMVNSRTFDVEYDLQAIGPWGVAKVELWGTHNGGRTWQSYGVDPDNRSPIRVTVPGAGVYGFRILVDGANGVSATSPRAGDTPELVVTVDLQPPTVELLAANLGQGNQVDQLLIRWTATDTNLEPRPIGLFYSTFPNGPWSTIAAGLENTGVYTWRLERHIPDRFYLRLEARDTAGNLATYQPSTPITLARPQPTGRLRGVRSVRAASTPMPPTNKGR